MSFRCILLFCEKYFNSIESEFQDIFFIDHEDMRRLEIILQRPHLVKTNKVKLAVIFENHQDQFYSIPSNTFYIEDSLQHSIQLIQLMINNFPSKHPDCFDSLLKSAITKCGIILYHKTLDSFLCIYRNGGIDFPKGHFKYCKESFVDCASRKFLEETGIILSNICKHLTPSIEIQNTLFFQCTTDMCSMRKLNKYEALCNVGWVSRNDIKHRHKSSYIHDFINCPEFQKTFQYGPLSLSFIPSSLQVFQKIGSSHDCEVRLTTYNVLSDNYDKTKSTKEYSSYALDNDFRWEKIIKKCHEWADKETIICLQEVTLQRAQTTLDEFCKHRDYSFFFEHSGFEWSGYMGNGILVPRRYKIISKKYFRVGEKITEENEAKYLHHKLVYIYIYEPNTNTYFSVVNFHFPVAKNHTTNTLISNSVLNFMIQNTPFPIFYAGDMNYSPTKDECLEKIVESKGFDSLWNYTNPIPPTQHTLLSHNCVDHIYFSKNKIECLEIEPIENTDLLMPNEKQPSDHTSVSAIFKINGEKEGYYEKNEIQVFIENHQELFSTIINNTIQKIKNFFVQDSQLSSLNIDIYSRIKSVDSIYNNLLLYNNNFFTLMDILGIQIVLYSSDCQLCYYLVDWIHQNFDFCLEKYDDYFKKDHKSKNLYRCIHTTLCFENKYFLEMQITTLEFNHKNKLCRLEYNFLGNKTHLPPTSIQCKSIINYLPIKPLDTFLYKMKYSLCVIIIDEMENCLYYTKSGINIDQNEIYYTMSNLMYFSIQKNILLKYGKRAKETLQAIVTSAKNKQDADVYIVLSTFSSIMEAVAPRNVGIYIHFPNDYHYESIDMLGTFHNVISKALQYIEYTVFKNY